MSEISEDLLLLFLVLHFYFWGAQRLRSERARARSCPHETAGKDGKILLRVVRGKEQLIFVCTNAIDFDLVLIRVWMFVSAPPPPLAGWLAIVICFWFLLRAFRVAPPIRFPRECGNRHTTKSILSNLLHSPTIDRCTNFPTGGVVDIWHCAGERGRRRTRVKNVMRIKS